MASIPRDKFLADVKDEHRRATEKFPANKKLDAALMEEVGELAKALLHIQEKGANPKDVYAEAVQVATVAMRIAVEGSPEHGYAGMKCGYLGCDQVTVGGPCALCYE
jgi:hypothetical protein